MPPPPPPPAYKKKVCRTIVFDFSWDDCNTHNGFANVLDVNKMHCGLYKESQLAALKYHLNGGCLFCFYVQSVI